MSASNKVPATDGDVVSKPVAKNTTFLSLLSDAILRASIGEYTTLISAPSALTSERFLSMPGTRIISPKVVKMIFSFLAIDMALSTSSTEVTHTGQPGPLIRIIFSGSSFLIPCLNIATV